MGIGDGWFAVWPPMCVMEAERNGTVCTGDGSSHGHSFPRWHSSGEGELSVAEARKYNYRGQFERRPCCKELGEPCGHESVSQPAELLVFEGQTQKALEPCTSGLSLERCSAQGHPVTFQKSDTAAGQGDLRTRM